MLLLYDVTIKFFQFALLNSIYSGHLIAVLQHAASASGKHNNDDLTGTKIGNRSLI